MLAWMMIAPTRLNVTRSPAGSASVTSGNYPQQQARNVSRTAGRFHSNGPEPVRPER